MTTLRSWLDARHPVVPDALKERLAVADDLPLSADGLTGLGIALIGRAHAGLRLDRDAAYQLLAADAFLTYACEAAADETDVASCLDLILDRCAAAWR